MCGGYFSVCVKWGKAVGLTLIVVDCGYTGLCGGCVSHALVGLLLSFFYC